MTQQAPQLEFLTTIKADLREPIPYGETSVYMRTVFPISGGRFEGPSFSGKVLPTGSDWNHYRPKEEALHLYARYDVMTDDGVPISIINEGIGHVTPDVPMKILASAPIEDGIWDMRTWPRFEAPIDSPYAWLNRTAFVGIIPYPKIVSVATVHVFKVK